MMWVAYVSIAVCVHLLLGLTLLKQPQPLNLKDAGKSLKRALLWPILLGKKHD